MTIFPNAVSTACKALYSIQLACMSHNYYDSCQPPCCMFWSAFWGLKSAAFSDFENVVIMSKLLQLFVITLILNCFLVWARYANVPSHYHAQGIKEMGVRHGHRHRQLCRPQCLGGLHGCLRADMTRVGSGEKEEETFHGWFLLPNAGGGQDRVWHGRLVYSYNYIYIYIYLYLYIILNSPTQQRPWLHQTNLSISLPNFHPRGHLQGRRNNEEAKVGTASIQTKTNTKFVIKNVLHIAL